MIPAHSPTLAMTTTTTTSMTSSWSLGRLLSTADRDQNDVAGRTCTLQIVFGRVQKTASAPTSPSVSRCSTPAPSELDDDEANDDDDDHDFDVGEAESEEEREELSKRETPKRDLSKPLREATPNPGEGLPAHSA